jgi:hypothetical protein
MHSAERFRNLVMVVATVLEPAPERSLQSTIAQLSRSVPNLTLADKKTVLSHLLGSGELERGTVDGVSYIWPARRMAYREAPPCVRLLAPFDPLVWDRRRFEHFWGWRYRFEAYTPPAKRLRGYYYMPLLWRDCIVGWANAEIAGNRLNVDFGFVERRPRDAGFRSELEREIARMETFLNLHNSNSA